MNRKNNIEWLVGTIPNETAFKTGRYNIYSMDEVPGHFKRDIQKRILAAMQEQVDPKKGFHVETNETWGERRFKVPMLIRSHPIGSIVLLTLDRKDGSGPKPIIARVLADQVVEIIAE